MAERRRYDERQLSLGPGLGMDPGVFQIDESGDPTARYSPVVGSSSSFWILRASRPTKTSAA